MTLFDHVDLKVRDYERSKAFYEAALEPLGSSLVIELDERRAAGFGPTREQNDFWITASDRPTQHVHVAFAARSRQEVDAFHARALAAGGRDNGPPGVRRQYHENYYGAYVLDPDGNNVEAVYHGRARS